MRVRTLPGGKLESLFNKPPRISSTSDRKRGLILWKKIKCRVSRPGITKAKWTWGWEESKVKSFMLLMENLSHFSYPSSQNADHQTGNWKILF